MHPTTKESGIKTNHINFKGKKNITNTTQRNRLIPGENPVSATFQKMYKFSTHA
jgi:hypothetical protein